MRWIGAEDSDNPAPIVSVTGGDRGRPRALARRADRDARRDRGAPASDHDDDDGGNGLAIVALIVGALGLIVGAAGCWPRRRTRAVA